MKPSRTYVSKRPDTHGSYVTFMPIKSTEMSIAGNKKNNNNNNKKQRVNFFGRLSESHNIYACADGMFEQERKTQYLQTPALERRTKRVIPGFRPVRSLLDAVGPLLLSATDLASRYGIEGEICRPLKHMRQIPLL